jgi:hypothetical protein
MSFGMSFITKLPGRSHLVISPRFSRFWSASHRVVFATPSRWARFSSYVLSPGCRVPLTIAWRGSAATLLRSVSFPKGPIKIDFFLSYKKEVRFVKPFFGSGEENGCVFPADRTSSKRMSGMLAQMWGLPVEHAVEKGRNRAMCCVREEMGFVRLLALSISQP